MKIKKIVIDDAVPYAHAIFSHLGEIITLPGKSINAATVKDADALIVRSRTQVNEDLLKNSNVSFVGSTVVGLDHINQTYLKNNGITFYSAQGCNANSVAEFIITILFQLAEQFEFDITQKTLGIIGVGNVGQRVYNKAKILGITCLLNDPPRIEKEPGLQKNPDFTDLDTCLTADIITVHTPLTKDGNYPTYQLICENKLAKIKPNQIIINAARGGIINEQAWSKTQTLCNIIDCWENEPYIDEALYKTALIATPHIAGHSLDAKVAGSSMVYHALCQHWNINPSNDWQQQLPEPPQPIKVIECKSIQKTLNDLFTQTHNIINDDLAIRSKNMIETHQKYENYRRNFPIYREWHQHNIFKTQNSKLNNLLESLGFTLSGS
ncbi:4-phosphoerythronate dehydrogenase [Thiomicrorhabdus sp.]|uniref:4-phosphoerythronate dehydrogenase n=1 Tax=Thiomicrorhabdus sp. TaxID=2039724 RepID=UPI002AA633F3|nr:4-phosphoerythronate dehydrogenase [Thiomicrorhabdus sp.]